mgnify:FL=1
MKLNNILGSLVIAIILISTTVMGYSGDTFSIEVGDGYEELAESGLVMFQKDTGDNIIVQEIDQKVVGGKLSNYQLNAIATEITNQYKETYDAEVEQSEKEETTINGRNVVKMTFRAEIANVGVIIQELNLFVYSDKIYDIIFTNVTADGFSEEEKNNILNSFEIKNAEADNVDNTNTTTNTEKTTPSLAWLALVVILLVLAILMIIGIKRNPKSKKYIAVIILYVVQVLAIIGYEAEEGAINWTDNIEESTALFIFALAAIIIAVMQILQKPKEVKPEEKIETKAKEIIEDNKKEEDK